MNIPRLLIHSLAALALSSAAIARAADDGEDRSTTEAVSAYVDDATITARVKAALAADKLVSALKVKVITENGVVMLSGVVDSPEAGARAIELAAGVDGVEDVKSALTVSGG